MFVHCVYFWLKDDMLPNATRRFTEGLSELTAIESVEQGYYGPPASTNRPVIDRSYDYGLVIICSDQAAHDAYQEHPVHDRFRETCADFWSEVKIYDVAASSMQEAGVASSEA